MSNLVALGDCTDRCLTWNPAAGDPDGEFDYIDLSSVDKDTKTIEGVSTIACSAAPSRARQIVKAGDILVSTVRPNLNGVAVVPVELDGSTASTGYTVLRPRLDRIDSSYLFHWVKHPEFIKEMVRLATGASYPAVSDKIVRAAMIPLPSLLEQRRIAAILDKADALRAKRREAIAKLDQLLQSVFLEMFGDPVTNPKGWLKHSLASVCLGITDCPHSTPTWSDEGIVCLRTPNLLKGSWCWDDTRYVSLEEYAERTKRNELSAGDIILSREGTVGIAAIVEDGMKLCMGQRLVQVRADKSQILPDFLLHLLLYDLAPERISRLMVGSTAKHLNVKDLKSLKVLLPPMALQEKFAMLLKSLTAQRVLQVKSELQVERLFSSLQNRAFAGAL